MSNISIETVVCAKLKKASNELAKIRNYNYRMVEASKSIKLYLSHLNKYLNSGVNKLRNPKICNKLFRNISNFAIVATDISEDFERLNKGLTFTKSDLDLYYQSLDRAKLANPNIKQIVFGCHFEKIIVLIHTIQKFSVELTQKLSELITKLGNVTEIPKCKSTLKQAKILEGIMISNKAQLDETYKLLSLINPVDADAPVNMPHKPPSRSRTRSRRNKFAPGLSEILEDGSLSRSSSSRTRRSRENPLSKSSSHQTRKSRGKPPSPQNIFAIDKMIDKHKQPTADTSPNVFGFANMIKQTPPPRTVFGLFNIGKERTPSLPKQRSSTRKTRQQG
jgi:hypothetical protein